MAEVIGWVVATRNRASGHLSIDWDGEIHHERHDGLEAQSQARLAGESAALLKVTLNEEDRDDA